MKVSCRHCGCFGMLLLHLHNNVMITWLCCVCFINNTQIFPIDDLDLTEVEFLNWCQWLATTVPTFYTSSQGLQLNLWSVLSSVVQLKRSWVATCYDQSESDPSMTLVANGLDAISSQVIMSPLRHYVPLSLAWPSLHPNALFITCQGMKNVLFKFLPK